MNNRQIGVLLVIGVAAIGVLGAYGDEMLWNTESGDENPDEHVIYRKDLSLVRLDCSPDRINLLLKPGRLLHDKSVDITSVNVSVMKSQNQEGVEVMRHLDFEDPANSPSLALIAGEGLKRGRSQFRLDLPIPLENSTWYTVKLDYIGDNPGIIDGECKVDAQ